jgi:hypothetical protein
MLVRLRKVDKEWEWYGARMLDPTLDGSPSDVIQSPSAYVLSMAGLGRLAALLRNS